VPTYQYACTECGDGFEAVQSFTDDALTLCPACGGRLRKVFSSVGIVFKGSGFYRTDSREAAKSESAAKDKTADQGSGGGTADKGAEKKSDAAAGGSGGSGGGAAAPAGTGGSSPAKSSTPASTGSSTKGSAA
jgi:putative FmdB family regulatory protein